MIKDEIDTGLSPTLYSKFFDKNLANLPTTFYNNNSTSTDPKMNRSLQILPGRMNHFFCRKCAYTFSEERGDYNTYCAPKRFHNITRLCPNNYIVFHSLSKNNSSSSALYDYEYTVATRTLEEVAHDPGITGQIISRVVVNTVPTGPASVSNTQYFMGLKSGTYKFKINGGKAGFVVHDPDHFHYSEGALNSSEEEVSLEVPYPWIGGTWTSASGDSFSVVQRGQVLEITEDGTTGEISYARDGFFDLIFPQSNTKRRGKVLWT